VDSKILYVRPEAVSVVYAPYHVPCTRYVHTVSSYIVMDVLYVTEGSCSASSLCRHKESY